MKLFEKQVFIALSSRVWTGGQWVQWETCPMRVQGNPLHLRKFPLHFLFCFSPSNDSNSWYQIQQFSKNIEFLEFFGFTLCFRTFQAKKKFKFFFHPTDRKISASIYLIFWRILKFFTTYRTDRKIACTSARLGSKPWALFAKPRLGTCKAVYHP